MKKPILRVANPGPSWGYHIISFFEKYLPKPVFNLVLGVGVAIGLLVMPRQRAYSKQYWETLTGKSPTIFEQYRHFRSFMEGLVLKLRAGRSVFPDFKFSETAEKEVFVKLCYSSEPVLFGTFHVGYSDMLGCMLRDFDRSISMVRLKVGNSLDTDVIKRTFAGSVRFIWVNEPTDFLFSLKEALQRGESLAMQCDRAEFSSKKEPFLFLGAKREFPMTIYYIADMFKCPVVFAFTGKLAEDRKIPVYTSPVFKPGPTKKENLDKARLHFQDVLNTLEEHLRKYPDLWFNFLPMDRVTGTTDDK